jgi:hypothetical protein
MMSPRRGRPLWVRAAVGIVIVAVVVGVFVLVLDRPAPLDYYRMVDDHTIVVGTVTGPATWTRITGLVETPESVTVFVSSLRAPLPAAGDDTTEIRVVLRDSLGGRTVIDGNSGVRVHSRP